MKNIPLTLIVFRFLLAPVIVGLTYVYGVKASLVIVILMYLGLISDIFDGILARKMNISTTKLRRLDSQVDLIFWVSTGISAWLLHADILAGKLTEIIILFSLEAACYLISFIRFGRETCTHAFLFKMFGLALLAAFTAIIGFGTTGTTFNIAFAVALLAYTDRILIILILPHWTHDIPSCYHAWLIRKGRDFKRYKLFN